MNIKDIIKIEIEKSLDLLKDKGEFDFSDKIFEIERPEDGGFGDYSSNVALKYAKEAKMPPREFAQKISENIKDNGIFKKVEIAGPGFLNFFLSDSFVFKSLKKAYDEGDNFGSSDFGKNKSVLIEFISANPTGELHLGHGRGAFFGDVLSNVLKFSGFSVTKEFYVNDAKKSTQINELGKTALGKGESYKTEKLLTKIEKIKDLLQDVKDESEAGSILAKELLKDIKYLVQNTLGIEFDNWFSEETLYESGKIEEVYSFLKEKGLIYEKDGAEWLKLSLYGDSEDRVIIRSDEKKSPTYLLPDIAYHKNKIERGFDKLINVWGADHQGHVKSMEAVMKLLGEDEQKLQIFITQMVGLKEGGERFKLSKRTGKIITIDWLVSEVGLDAVRFFYTLKSIDTQMEFDISLAKEQSEKNPVFYVQYAHARMFGILNNAKESFLNFDVSIDQLSLLSSPQERKLMLEVLKFPEVVKEVAVIKNTQTIPHYAMDLARRFHSFYSACRVLGNEDENLDKARLFLVKLTQITLKNALSLLGVSAPEKM